MAAGTGTLDQGNLAQVREQPVRPRAAGEGVAAAGTDLLLRIALLCGMLPEDLCRCAQCVLASK